MRVPRSKHPTMTAKGVKLQPVTWLQLVQCEVTCFSSPVLGVSVRPRRRWPTPVQPHGQHGLTRRAPHSLVTSALMPPSFLHGKGPTRECSASTNHPEEMLFPMAPCPVFAQKPTSCCAPNLGVDFPQVNSSSPRLMSNLHSAST